MSQEGKFLRRQMVLALSEDVQRLWNLVKDDLKPDRLLNVAIGILRELSKEGAAAILPKATFLGYFAENQSASKN